MNNVEIILQLLTDLKSEQQLLNEQINSIQNLLIANNKQKNVPAIQKSFKEWRKSVQKSKL